MGEFLKLKIENMTVQHNETQIESSPKEVVKISVKFKGNGALTFPSKA